MITQIKKGQLGALMPIGRGGTGEVYKTGIQINKYKGPFLYKEYNKRILPRIDLSVLDSMVRYIEQLSIPDSSSLLSICSWPLAIVLEDYSNQPIGFLMQAAPDCFKNSNFSKKVKDYKGFQQLFREDSLYELDTGCARLLYAERELVISRVALSLAELHKRNIAVGDISPNNILVAMFPDYIVYLIDTDSMCFQGKSIFRNELNETSNWQITTFYPNEPSGTSCSDCLKLGLMASRILLKSHLANGDVLPQEASDLMKDLIHRSLNNPSQSRPNIFEWTQALESQACVNNVARSFMQQGREEARQGNRDKARIAFDKAVVLDRSTRAPILFVNFRSLFPIISNSVIKATAFAGDRKSWLSQLLTDRSRVNQDNKPFAFIGQAKLLIGFLGITSLSFVLIGQIEDQMKLRREQSSLVKVQKYLDSGNYRRCIEEVANIRAELRDKLRIHADSLRTRCMNRSSAINAKPLEPEKKVDPIAECGLTGDWTIASRIEGLSDRERILKLVKAVSCSDSYIEGDTIIASRKATEGEALRLSDSLNRLLSSRSIDSSLGFVAQSRIFSISSALFAPINCDVSIEEADGKSRSYFDIGIESNGKTNSERCIPRYQITGRYQTPSIEIGFSFSEGHGAKFVWHPSEDGYTSPRDTSVSCSQEGMLIEHTNGGGAKLKVGVPFKFLPCSQTQLEGICAIQSRYNESMVLMTFGGCRFTEKTATTDMNGRKAVDIVSDTGVRIRFIVHGSDSTDLQRAFYFQRANDKFPRTESFVWAQRPEGIVINHGQESLLIGGLEI